MPSFLTIKRLRLKAGLRPGAAPLEFNPPTVTVVVGPNGSGKTRLLTEIDGACRVEGVGVEVVLNEVEVEWPTSAADALALVKQFEAPPAPHEEQLAPGRFRLAPTAINVPQQMPVYDESAYNEYFRADLPANYERDRRSSALRYFVLRVAGRDRFNLIATREQGDLQGPPANHLARLFKDDALRARVSQDIAAALGRSFVLDPTHGGQLRPRLSDTPPPSPDIERGLTDVSIAFHRAAALLEQESDGTQSFVGLVAALHSVPHRVILIDEPEAHLHPTLALRVGRLVAALGEERDATVIAATHSAEFLMGCLEAGTNVAIVRLTYERASGNATARLLDANSLQTLMSDPYARSTNALDAVFSRAAVLCEADADRAFYQEANRLLEEDGRGVQDTRFIGMQTWANIARVAAPLRRLGVPAAMILDIDTVTDVEGAWANVWEAIGLEAADPERSRVEAARLAVRADLDALGAGKPHKGVGVNAFGPGTAERSRLDSLIADLAAYGVFLVPEGQLEGWLRPLNPPTGKKNWIVFMLPALQNATVANDDVWLFLDQIEAWVANPNRLGTG